MKHITKRNPINEQKEQYLQKRGVLNPHPERVQDELFQSNEFFDPNDLLQVRYEMIRRHRVDKVTIKETTKRFGVSRVTFYQVAGTYDRKGLIGFVPKKPGPKNPHKCTEEIIDFIKQRRSQKSDVTWKDLIHDVQEEFGVTLHRRTIERGLARRKKKETIQRDP